MSFPSSFPDQNPSISQPSKNPPVIIKKNPSKIGMAISHAVNVPVKLIKTIADIVKLALFTVLAALCFGQSDSMNEGVKYSFKKVVLDAIGVAISTIGVFTPTNANKLQIGATAVILPELFKSHTNLLVGDLIV